MSISNQADQPEFPSERQSQGQVVYDLFELLTKLSQLPSSGKLTLCQGTVSWRIYISNRRLQSAFLSIQSLESLSFHLKALNYKQALEVIQTSKDNNYQNHPLNNKSIDEAITWLSEKNILDSDQLSQTIEKISWEALEPVFWLDNATLKWERKSSIPPTLSISNPPQLISLVQQGRDRLQSWQNLLDQIQSPYQRPYLSNRRFLENSSDQILVKLSKLMRGLSFHEIALLIKQDEINLVRKLYPSVKSGTIVLREPKSPWNRLPILPRIAPSQLNSNQTLQQERLKIACVDDSPTILREIQRLLGEEDYEIIKIGNPVEAASILFRVKPDLILMDISMPEINGYKLCSLLRNSKTLAEVPIIMVTSRTGMIDKVRAKASGATDYLTKPFTQDSLLEIIQQYS